MAAEGPRKRLPAVLTGIPELVNGKFVRTEGDFEPNYVELADGRKASRVQVFGVLVRKGAFLDEDNPNAYAVIDDGRGILIVRTWDYSLAKLIAETRTGQSILVVGRPRLSKDGSTIFVVAELIKRLTPNEELLKRAELLKIYSKRKPLEIELVSLERVPEEPEEREIVERYVLEEEEEEEVFREELEEEIPELEEEEEAEEVVESNDKSVVVDIIRSLGGEKEPVEYGRLVEEARKKGLSEDRVQAALRELLLDGTIFEPKPNQYKLI